MISSILFDFGGTLDSDGGHWLDRNYRTYELLGFGHINKNLIKEAFYFADRQAETDPAMRIAPYRKMMELHFAWQFQKLNLKNLAKQGEAVTLFVGPAERLLRRNRKTLEALSHKPYRMGIVSNAYGNMELLCREFDYNAFITVFIDSIIENVSKPDPKIYELALERLKSTAAETLMVGDNFERDILPAKSLGMKTAWLNNDSKRTAPDPSKVDINLRSLEELPERLKKFETAAK